MDLPRGVRAFSRAAIRTKFRFASQKSDRQQAREGLAAYHEAKLAELVAHVSEAIDRFRDGELKAVDVVEVLFQYSRAAKALWRSVMTATLNSPCTSRRELRRSTGGNAKRQDAPGPRSTKCQPANLDDRQSRTCVTPPPVPQAVSGETDAAAERPGRAGAWGRPDCCCCRLATAQVAASQRLVVRTEIRATLSGVCRDLGFREPRRAERGERNRRSHGGGGAACRNRTDDLLITSETLCRLS